MKKIIIAVVLLLMFGYSVYEFAGPFGEEKASKEAFDVVEGQEEIGEESDATVDHSDAALVGTSVGNLAPDFTLTTAAGDTVSLSDYRGTKVMLNFWGTWCPPCRAEMPDMEKFYQEHDVEILAVNLTPTESAVTDVIEFIEDFGLSFQVLLDEELSVSSQYGIQPVPTSFMIDSHGIVQYVALGAVNYEQMVQAYRSMD